MLPAMDFALDDEQALIVQTVRRFVDKDVRGWAADADRAGAAPDRLFTLGPDLGFFGDTIDLGGNTVLFTLAFKFR